MERVHSVRGGQMSSRQFLLLVALTVVAGLVGGAVSNWVLVSATGETKQYEKVVAAQEFRLVDEEGALVARTGPVGNWDEPSLTLLDSRGRVVWRAR